MAFVIEITFKDKKPRYPVKIKIVPGESSAKSKEFTRHDGNRNTLCCEDDIHLSPDCGVGVVIKESHALKWRAKREFALVHLEAEDIGEDLIITKDDKKGLISVKFTFEPPAEASIVVCKGADDAVDLLKKKPIALEKLGRARKFVEVVMKFGDVIADVHPAAKAAVISFNLLYERFEEQENIHKDASDLIEDLQQFLPFTEVVDPSTLTNKPARNAIKDFLTVFKETCEFIVQYSSIHILGDLISSQRPRIDELKSDFQKAKGRYDWSIKTGVWKINMKIEKIRDNQVLKLLSVSTYGPAGKEFYRTDKACTAGTRTDIIKQISRWAETPSERKLLWMHGPPGCGKSAIANSVAHKFDGQQLLAGCFFSRRDDPDLRDTSKVMPSIAAHLAMWHQPFCDKLLSVLQGQERHKLASKTVQEQFEILVRGPISSLSSDEQSKSPHPLIIVVDGLDECGKTKGQRIQLAKMLVQTSELVPWLKLFVSSRPLPELGQVFEGSPVLLEKLDLGQAGDPTADMILYAKYRVQAIAQENALDETWLTEEEIVALIEKSHGRFIWISSVFSFIEGHTDIDHAVAVVLAAPSIDFERLEGDVSLLCMESLQKAESDLVDLQMA